MKMLPSSTRFDVSDRVPPNAVFCGDDICTTFVGYDLQNLNFGKFAGRGLFTTNIAPAPKPMNIRNVGFLTVPTQVSRVYAAWIAAIAMACKVIGGIGPIPSVQNQRNVRGHKCSVLNGKCSVSVTDFSARPNPAIVWSALLNFRPKVCLVDFVSGALFHAVRFPIKDIGDLTPNASFSQGVAHAL